MNDNGQRMDFEADQPKIDLENKDIQRRTLSFFDRLHDIFADVQHDRTRISKHANARTKPANDRAKRRKARKAARQARKITRSRR